MAAGEPVADGAGIAGLAGEAIELELHEHRQAVEKRLVGQQVRAAPHAQAPAVSSSFFRSRERERHV
jgi:hypothetical protein